MASAIYQCIEQIGSKIIENKEFLTELDREIGDADHGINMARGFTEALKAVWKIRKECCSAGGSRSGDER